MGHTSKPTIIYNTLLYPIHDTYIYEHNYTRYTFCVCVLMQESALLIVVLVWNSLIVLEMAWSHHGIKSWDSQSNGNPESLKSHWDPRGTLNWDLSFSDWDPGGIPLIPNWESHDFIPLGSGQSQLNKLGSQRIRYKMNHNNLYKTCFCSWLGF